MNAPYSTFTGALGQALRPFPQYDFIADDCCLENLGHSSYNAMLVSLARRFRNGLNLQASYTWSKTLTNADSAIPFSYTSNNQREQAANSTDLKMDKAVSVQDLTNQFSLSYLYQLPFGKGRKWMNDQSCPGSIGRGLADRRDTTIFQRTAYRFRLRERNTVLPKLYYLHGGPDFL